MAKSVSSSVSATPSPRDIENARKAAWRQKSAAKLRSQRRQRADGLEASEVAFNKALIAYAEFGDFPNGLSLRRSFVALPKARVLDRDAEQRKGSQAERRAREVATRPPSTRLLGRQGRALTSYLTMVWVASLGTEPGSKSKVRRGITYSDDASATWATLCGRYADSPTARRDRMTRDLKRLGDAGLVRIPDREGRSLLKDFKILDDAGSGRIYRPPRPDEPGGLLHLPPSFFTHGWHLVLTELEIATLLAIYDAWWRIPQTVESPTFSTIRIPRSTREGRYGISGEAYTSIHELEEFGLISVLDTLPGRQQGKLTRLAQGKGGNVDLERSVATPYALTPWNDEVFERNARDVVLKCLNENSEPPRLDVLHGLFASGRIEAMSMRP